MCQDDRFLSLDEYRRIAVQTILKFFPKYSDLVYNNDAVEEIIQKIMEGDWKHHASRSTRTTHRCNSAKYAIMSIVCKKTEEDKNKSEFIETHKRNDDAFYYHDPVDVLDLLLDIQDTEVLKNKERECLLQTYFLYKKPNEIAENLKMSASYVRQYNVRAIQKLQRKFGV